MSAAGGLWAYIAQWFGYVAACASASDAACRPFLGFLALAGAAAGALTLIVLRLRSMSSAWMQERDERHASTATATRSNAAVVERSRDASVVSDRGTPLSRPAMVGGESMFVHAEPPLAAAVGLPGEREPTSVVRPTASALDLP